MPNKKQTNKELFLETLKEIRNYIAVVMPELIQEYGFEESYGDYNYYPIIALLEVDGDTTLKNDVQETYDISIIKKFGGYEDAGSEMWYVFKFKDTYFKLPCSYSSYDSNEYYWDDVYEVKPVEKTITVYQRTDGQAEIIRSEHEVYAEDSW